MNELWLVRHGKTEWSANGRHVDDRSAALPEGEEVGRWHRALAEVDLALVLTSPRERARRTAELAGFPDAEVDDDLVEWDYGDYEGVTTKEIRQRVPGWTVWNSPVPGGETPESVSSGWTGWSPAPRPPRARRSSSATATRPRPAARWPRQPVTFGQHRADTATLSRLGWEHEAPVVLRWNS